MLPAAESLHEINEIILGEKSCRLTKTVISFCILLGLNFSGEVLFWLNTALMETPSFPRRKVENL